MKHNVKRVLSALLVLCMLLSVLPASVLADDPIVVGIHTVTFYDENGTTTLKEVAGVAQITVADIPVCEPPAGYTVRWADQPESVVAGGAVSYLDLNALPITLTADASYYRHYAPSTYSWTATGNTTNTTGDVTFGSTFTVPAFDGTAPDGQKFLAWNGSDGRTYLAGSEYLWTVAGSLTLTPMFVDASTEYYFVKFATESGLFDVQPIKKTADAKLVLPTATPTKDGYTFNGWFNGDTQAVAGSDVTADVTYVAVWTANTYTLTYYRGAEADASENKCYLTLGDTTVEFYNNAMPDGIYVSDLKAGDTVKLGTPSLAGYSFLYWLAEDGTHYAAGQTLTMPAGDVKLTAVWEEKKDSVIVLFKDGEKIIDLVIGIVGEKITIPAEDPTANGKTFEGWECGGSIYSNGNGHTEVEIDETLLTDGVLTLTAQWNEEIYHITYAGDGVTATDTNDYKYGDSAVLAAAPEREGYTFIAWEAGGAYYGANAAVEVKDNLNLTAVWQEDKVEYVVKFFDEKGNLVDVILVEKNGAITTPKYEQGRTDATYVWADEANHTYVEQNVTFTVDKNYSFKAVKTDETEYTVTVNVAPNTITNATDFVTQEHKLGETVLLKITVPEGYILKSVDAFAGAVTAADAVSSSLIHVPDTENYNFYFTMPAANVTVMVEFEKIPAGKSYVKFMVDGALFDYDIVTKGENGTTPATEPTKAGYTFTAWKSGTTVVGANEAFAVAADAEDIIVFEAQFTQDTYTVDYDTDGGVPQPTSSAAHYGDQITLAAVPTKAGHIFIGWVEESTGFLYAAGATYTVTDDVKFTAKWEQAECIVRFIDPETGIIYGYEPIHQGDTVTAPVAPTISGKTFQKWVDSADPTVSVEAGGTTAQIYTDTTFHASYTISEHNVTFVGNNATIAAAGSVGTGGYAVGSTVNFTVTANTNYAISSVVMTYTDGVSTVIRELNSADGNYSFIMPDADVTVTATATQNVFNINTVSDVHSGITASGTSAEVGASVSFNVAVDADYVLRNVIVEGKTSGTYIPVIAEQQADGTVDYYFTMPAEDVIIYAQTAQAERTVTFLDSDNTLLGIVPVGSGNKLDTTLVPVPTKDGYTFARWLTVPGKVKFDPATDIVTEDLIVKATYVGDTHTVVAGLTDNIASLNAKCTVSSGSENSSDLFQTALTAETGKTVYFTVAAKYDWVITDVAVVSAIGTNLVVEPVLREKKTGTDNLVYYTYAFEMPAEDVKIDVYTTAKLFNVSVEENIAVGGDYTIDGHFTNNLWAQQGKEVTVAVTPNPGYEIVGVTGTYVDNLGNTANLGGVWDGTAYTFTMVAKDVKINIKYVAIDYTVNVKDSNAESYKPDASVNPAKVVESLNAALTSKGIIRIVGVSDVDFTNAEHQVYKIPDNGTRHVGDRVGFTVEEFTGYDLATLTVTYDNGEKSCPITYKSGVYYFDMPADDVVITATFVEETYTVTKDAKSEAHGKVTMNGLVENTISVDYKDLVEIVVTPDDGYQVTKISYKLADGSVMDFDAASYTASSAITDALDTAHSITFHMPASAVTVSVEYAAIDYTITDVCGEATATYTTPKHVGQQVNFTTKANYGYVIEKVYVVNDATDERVEIHTVAVNTLYGADYTFTMPASSVTIHVETIKDEYDVYYLDRGTLVAEETVAYLTTAHVSAHVNAISSAPAGHHFVGWISSDVQTPVTVPSVNDDDFVVIKKTYIYAAYDKDEIDVFFTATEHGTVTELFTGANNTAEYRLTTTVFGDKVSFTAVPDEGYVVDTVSVTTTNGEGYVLELACVVSGNKYTFTIPASYKDSVHTVQAEDVVVTVTFKKGEYTLTKATDCETNGTIAVNGQVTTETSFTYNYQDSVTITATPNNGYYVAGITAVCGDGAHKFTVSGTKPATDTAVGAPLTLAFKMPACDLTYTVDYEKIDYSVTTVFDATQGDVTTAPAGIAQIDDIVTVTVTPKTGYRLVSLTATYANGEKSCVLTEIGTNVYTFTMPAAAVTVTAIFDEVAYKATLKVEGEAYVSLNGQHAEFIMEQYLDTVVVSVTPSAGWELVSVIVDGGKVKVNETVKPTGGDYTFTMPNHDVTIEVKLEKTGFDMTAYALNFFETGHGTVTLTPKDKAYVGDRITITADPDDGYRVHEVVVVDKYGNAVPVSFISGTPGYVETWSFTMPAAEVEIVVYFILNGSSYYTDVRTDDWHYEAVTFVTDRGYFKGMTEELFAPNLEMNRAMFVTVLGRISRVDVTKYTTTKFTDVDAAQYYAPYVAWAEENGIVLGRDKTTFDPEANITREEMAAIMYRYCKFLGEDMTVQNKQFMDRYVDAKDISDWAKESVEWAVGVGLIKGMSPNTIDPQGLATRAQVAQVIKNLCDKVLYE